MDRTTTRALLGLLVVCGVIGCNRGPERIVVGSKNFTEQVVLGEILAQHIESRLGLKVDRRLNLGGTLLAHEAVRTGAIDLYPEYSGTALSAVLKHEPLNDPETVRNTVRTEYHKRWNLAWTSPLGFENTFAMVVRNSEPVETLTQAARLPRRWRLGAGYEFVQRADGLPGLLQAYRLELNGAPITMDLGLLYQALTQGNVDIVAANSTDGLLSVLEVKTLKDDERYFPPYECAVVVREETLSRFPRLQAALDELSGKLDSRTMQRLNWAVDANSRTAPEAAAEFLRTLR